MAHRSSSSRSYRKPVAGPFLAFLIVASFGLLFVGCKGPESVSENQDFVFTQENVDQAHQLAVSYKRIHPDRIWFIGAVFGTSRSVCKRSDDRYRSS
jgi:hypothetical protein